MSGARNEPGAGCFGPESQIRGPSRAGFPLLSHRGASSVSNVRSRTKLKQAQVKVKTARALLGAAVPQFARTAHGLHPAEGLLYDLASA